MQYHTAPSPTPCSITLRRVKKLKCPKIQNCLPLRRVGLCTVRYCTESDSAQCDTALSLTPRSVILRRVKYLFLFSKTSISMTFRFYVMIFRNKIRKYFENPKMSNTAQSFPTLHSITLSRVLPGTILSLQASPCLQ